MKEIPRSKLIKELRVLQGGRSNQQFARDMGLSPQYFSKVLAGIRPLHPAMLELLGAERRLRSVVHYFR